MPDGQYYFRPWGVMRDVWAGDVTLFRNVLLTGAEYTEHEGRTVLMFPHTILDHRVNVKRRAEGTPAVPVPPVWYDLETDVIRSDHSHPYVEESLYWLAFELKHAVIALKVHRGDLAQQYVDVFHPYRARPGRGFPHRIGDELRRHLEWARQQARQTGERAFPYYTPMLYDVHPDGSIWRGTGYGNFRVVQPGEEI